MPRRSADHPLGVMSISGPRLRYPCERHPGGTTEGGRSLMSGTARGQAPRVVLDGLVFPEVPRWRDGQLWFCDFQLWFPDLTGQVMVVDGSGRAYVNSTDAAGMPRPAPSEQMVVHPDGRVEVADSAMRFPNGTVITPDGGTLIVAESTGECLTAFTIAGDGSLGDKRVWAAVPGTAPDGICLDQEGCVWFADARGNACVRVAEGGQVRDRVETDQGAFACTLGGDDGRTLFVTTSVNPFMGAASGRPGRIVAFQVEVPGTGSP